VFSLNFIAYRNVVQHELMGSHEVFEIFEYISIDGSVIRENRVLNTRQLACLVGY
jgi:hypothetical protein